jgi:hypothetical protein
MKARALWFALLPLAGCGWAASRTLIGPDTYEISCGAPGVCYDAASDECPDGYTELEHQQWSTGQTVQTQSYGPPEARTTNVQVYDRPANRLVVRCSPKGTDRARE